MNILDEIAARTKARIKENKKYCPAADLRRQAEAIAAEEQRTSGFVFPFEQALSGDDISFICEVKKASPSKGVIAEDFRWLDIAQDYDAAGADAISCLTEPFYFLGKDEYLKEISEHVSIPVLRKDFTVDEYMLYQAKTLGASAVLLICSLLDDGQLKAYRQLSDELGLSALTEAHTEKEIERALKADARIVGVNNRNLKNFQVNVSCSHSLRSLVPGNILFVSESGIRTPEDIRLLRADGADAVLIGETLMRAKDKKATLHFLKYGNCRENP